MVKLSKGHDFRKFETEWPIKKEKKKKDSSYPRGKYVYMRAIERYSNLIRFSRTLENFNAWTTLMKMKSLIRLTRLYAALLFFTFFSPYVFTLTFCCWFDCRSGPGFIKQ